MYYIARIQTDKNAPQYLCRGRLVAKEHATKHSHPSAARKAIESFMKQRRGHISTDVEKLA